MKFRKLDDTKFSTFKIRNNLLFEIGGELPNNKLGNCITPVLFFLPQQLLRFHHRSRFREG